jgi:hypothetical protein
MHPDDQIDDLHLTCADCQKPFIFSVGEQRFFRERNLIPTRRCITCRKLRRLRSDPPGPRSGGWRNDEVRSQNRGNESGLQSLIRGF